MYLEVVDWEVWDFTKPFGYFEAFSGIVVVLACALVVFFILRHFRPS